MARKIVNNADVGNATHFGGDDIDYINKYLTAVDQTATDPVDINTNTTYRNQKLRIRNPANTFSYIYNAAAIVADRNINLPLLTADDTLLFANHPATIAAKTIDAKTQTRLRGFLTDSTVKRWGTFTGSPAGKTVGGVLYDVNPIGTPSAGSFDITYGYYENYQSNAVANSNAGLNINSLLSFETIRRWNPYMVFVFATPATTSQRLFCGFTSITSSPSTDTLIGNTDNGVFFGYRSSDANYSVFNNDGGGAMVVTASGTAKDTSVHKVEIYFDNSVPNCVVTLDGSTIATLTSRIPSATVPLFVMWKAQTTISTARDLRMYDIYYEDVKSA